MDYIERRCKDCGTMFEVRTDKLDTLYADYCAQCFFANVRLFADGTMELKKEKSTVDTSYKDELQGITHRGKHRCNGNEEKE